MEFLSVHDSPFFRFHPIVVILPKLSSTVILPKPGSPSLWLMSRTRFHLFEPKVRHNSVPTVPVRAYMAIGTELRLLNPRFLLPN